MKEWDHETPLVLKRPKWLNELDIEVDMNRRLRLSPTSRLQVGDDLDVVHDMQWSHKAIIDWRACL